MPHMYNPFGTITQRTVKVPNLVTNEADMIQINNGITGAFY